MAQIGEITVPVNFEMTETSKWILRKMIVQILHEPAVLKALLEDLSKQATKEEVK